MNLELRTMSAWEGGLRQALSTHAGTFGVRMPDAAAEQALDAARQTGFVWTRQPGVVCLAADRRYLAMAADNPMVVAIIVPPALARHDAGGRVLVVADRPDELYHHLHATQSFPASRNAPRVDASAQVDASAVLKGDVTVGARAIVGPRVVIDGPVRIGDDVRIEAGAILGCDGVFAKQVAGVRVHVPHFGGIEVGDGAFIHAGAVVVRSAVRGEATRIGPRAHVGVMCNIGHDATVGEAATISSNVVVAGRATVGARAWIGASATISNMVRVGEGAEVRIGAVVVRDVPADGDVSGNFARPHAMNLREFLDSVRRKA